MSFLYEIISGNIVEGVEYQVTGSGTSIVYNSTTYAIGSYFTGVAGVDTYTKTDGTEIVTEASIFKALGIGQKAGFFFGKFTDESFFKGVGIGIGDTYEFQIKTDIYPLINIKYKDSANWTSVTGIVTDWSKYNERFAQSGVRPEHLEPTDYVDSWAEHEFKAQIVKFKGWYVDFIIDEGQIHDLENLLNCEKLIVTDVLAQKEWHANTEKSDYINLEISQIDNTSKYNCVLKFRTEKTIINKKEPILNKYNLTCDFNYFYTDLDLVYEQQETFQNVFSNDSEIDRLTLAIPKKTANLLFYMNETQKNDLREAFETTENNYIQLLTFHDTGAIVANVDVGLEITTITFDADIDDLKKGQICEIHGGDVIVYEIVDNRKIDVLNLHTVILVGDILYARDIIEFKEPALIASSENFGEGLFRCEVKGTI
jgi:hypothetical protein